MQELCQLIVDEVAALVGMRPDEIELDRPLAEYGLSSRDAATLAGYLESVLGRPLSPTIVWEHPTIAALASALTGAQTSSDATVLPAQASDPIAIVGLGFRLPGGQDGPLSGPGQLWRFLASRGEAVGEVPASRWSWYFERAHAVLPVTRRAAVLRDVAGFDAEFFGISPGEATAMDPQQRMLLEVSWEALEHAGLPPRSLRGSRTGVFAGISTAEYAHLSTADAGRIDAWTATGAAPSVAAGRVSYLLDLRGPSLAVDTACSSSLVAAHLAAASLRTGECDLALAGGVNLMLSPVISLAFDAAGGTSPDGHCRPFDAAANGMVRGEGCGVVVLKRLADARRDGDRVLAVLISSAVGSDGRSNGLVAPNPDAQRDLLQRAYAGIDLATVGYVEAHGTGTPLGDPIEAQALGEVLGGARPEGQPLLIGSVKANIGHLEAAAGVAGLIKAVLALARRQIPPSANFTQPSPHIPFGELGLAVPDTTVPWPASGLPARAGVSAFGFSGTNAHVVLEENPERPIPRPPQHTRVRLLLSDITPARIGDQAGMLSGWLEGPDGQAATDDVAATLARRAGRGPHRRVLVASNAEDLRAGLAALVAGQPHQAVISGVETPPGPGLVFVFSGYGAQWAGMGARLADHEPVFAAAIDELNDIIKQAGGPSLRQAIRSGAADLDRVECVQPVLFGLQVALARLWESYGVTPAAVIGHSMGEIAAAVVSGFLTAADGARVITRRSLLLSKLIGAGAMAIIGLPADDVAALGADLNDVHIAVLTAPSQTVVTGAQEQVAELTGRARDHGISARQLGAAGAGHSPQVDPLVPELIEQLGELAPVTGDGVRFYSTVSEDPRLRPTCDAAYWAANMRQPVRFAPAVAAAAEDGFRVFVEVSAHPLVRQAIAQTLRDQPGEAVIAGTLTKDTDDNDAFHRQLAVLTAAGAAPAHPGRQVIDLPPAPWRHERYWAQPQAVGVPHREKIFRRSWENLEAITAAGNARDRHWLVLGISGRGLAPLLATALLGCGANVRSEAVPHGQLAARVTDFLRAGHESAGIVVVAPSTPVRDAISERFLADLIAVARQAPRLWIVTTGGVAVSEREAGDPGLAAVQGLVRVLAVECPAMRATLLDADPSTPMGLAAEIVAAELLRDAPDDEVAWRDGRRLVARFTRAEPAAPAPDVRPGGAYLITGGYGGLGLVVARWLAGCGAHRLVLAGRSGPSAEGLAAIGELRSLGTEVVVVRGDVACGDDASAMVAAATAEGVALRGVVHAAGVFGDALVPDVTREALSRVWRPKVRGARALHEAIEQAGVKPDWMVLFSSAAALLGSPGQVVYATANAWLDGFAAWRSAWSQPTYSIGWGVWGQTGQAAEIAIPGIEPLQPDEAIEDLAALLAGQRPATAVIRIDPARVTAAFPEISAIPFFRMLPASGTPVRGDRPSGMREIIAAVLGLPSIGDNVVLTDAGVDSLAAQRITSLIEQELGISIEPSTILGGATLADLCAPMGQRRHLESPTGQGRHPEWRQGAIGPRDAAERQLLRIVSDVLGAPDLGVTDDLQTAGLTAALGRAIAARLVTETGRPVDTRELLSVPTVEAAAGYIRRSVADEAALGLMPLLRPADENAAVPLVLAHPAGGDTDVYKNLARMLETNRPVFGLERLTGSVTDRAARYVAQITSRIGTGRVVTGGWSFGGVVGYEIAQQLAADGRQPDLVVLLDAALPLPLEPGTEEQALARRFAAFAEYLSRTYGRQVALHEEELTGMPEDEQFALLTERMAASGLTDQLSPAILTHQLTSHEDTRALERYQAVPYPGPVVLYRAELPTPWAVHDPRYEITDPARGWAPLCARLEVVPIRAHHLNLLDPPAVHAIAAHLGTLLAAGQQRRTTEATHD
jgi:acyl transferase domain-containing protein/thioesterase domain-containing protein/NAD(P)-dependent dehydrogenase (short-subunit alcohol dehydrogenase family)/acyl carrier protein